MKRTGRAGDLAGGAASPEGVGENRDRAGLRRRDAIRTPSPSLRDAGGENSNRQLVKGGVELPRPTALARQAARQARAVADAPGRGRREPDFEMWARLTPRQRRQPKWRALAAQWRRLATARAGTIAALAGHAWLDGLDLSVEEARRLLGGEPDGIDPVVRAMRQSVDPQDLTTGSGPFPRPEGKDR